MFFGSERHRLKLQSLSASGAALVCATPLPAMPFLRLHFKLEGASDVFVDGVPVRSEETGSGTLLAVRFLDPPVDTVALIEAFAARHRANAD